MSRAPRYLGLDIGTCTGYALVEGDKLIQSGVRDFSVKKSQHIGHRGIYFQNFLIDLGRVDEIYYEKIQFVHPTRGGDQGELYKGFLMLLNMYAAGYMIPAIGVWPGTLKKNFTGSGAADKRDMCHKARQLGWQGGQEGAEMFHDEVDAIALLVTELKNNYGITVRF